MKGGITSGVVYPKLIAALADKYQFKNIGGTSAGAIAAAGCAAAEYGRQHGKPDRFDRLSRLPDELTRQIGTPKGSMLFHLFQPASSMRRHFAVLVSMLNAPRPLKAVGSGLAAMVSQFKGYAALGLLLALLLFSPIVLMAAPGVGWLAALVAVATFVFWVVWGLVLLRRLEWLAGGSSLGRLLLWWAVGLAATAAALRYAGATEVSKLLLAAPAGAVAMTLCVALVVILSGLRFGSTLLQGLHGNFYGLCSGRTANSEGGAEGLTDWLLGYFNTLAGLPTVSRPLTFGDLWGQPPDLDKETGEEEDRPASEREINLEVMTTAVSQKQCYSIPFIDTAPAFYYDESEWRRLFPDAVVDWLIRARAAESAALAASGTYAEESGVTILIKSADNRTLRRLPSNRYLPVVVAVRMSLSFPVLLSAVPLYSVDRSLQENTSEKKRQDEHERLQGGKPETFTYKATRIWFSDGGIASNMPLHFFDAALPGHPTFAVNLKEPHPSYPIQQGIAACQQEGRVYLPEKNIQGHIRYWPEPDDAKPLGILGFLWSIIATMQNWRDEIQFPYPGYRDRIVQISQLPDEGGLNLNMPKQNIDALSDAGECAARKLIERFHPDSTAQAAGGWENHQEVRVRTFLAILERISLSLHGPLQQGQWQAVVDRVAAAHDYTAADAALAKDCLDRLRDLGAVIVQSGRTLERRAPRPRATMRIAPRI